MNKRPFGEAPALLENGPKILVKASVLAAKGAGTFDQQFSKIKGLVPD